MFDKELFMSLCEKYNVKFRDTSWLDEENLNEKITKEDIDKMFAVILHNDEKEKGESDGQENDRIKQQTKRCGMGENH